MDTLLNAGRRIIICTMNFVNMLKISEAEPNLVDAYK